MKIIAAFNLKDWVMIKELSIKGRVTEINVDSSGITYRVRYFDNREARFAFFDGDELEMTVSDAAAKQLGFKT